MMFTKAIVKRPGNRLIHGIREINYGTPDPVKAFKQHDNYIRILRLCGLDVVILEEDEKFPDSVFVEDTALCTSKVAVITYPGAKSRRGEEKEIRNTLTKIYSSLEIIKHPGTVEGGDVMMAGDHFYIGISNRTNEHGAKQLIRILEKYGYSSSTIRLKHFLHLKSGITYLENNVVLGVNELLKLPVFSRYETIEVPDEEAYAANSLWVNNKVLVPFGYPKTLQMLKDKGYETITLDVSEFRKLNGGLSCLSLRLPIQ